MHLLAIDPSLTMWGIAVADARGPHAPTSWRPPGSGTARLAACRDRLAAICDEVDPQVVVLEGYSYRSSGSAVLGLAELGGVLRLLLHDRRLAWCDVPPAAAKRWATGSGAAPKERVLVEAIRRLDYVGHSHHEADALWMLHMAAAHYELAWAAQVPAAHRSGRPPPWPVRPPQRPSR